MQRHDLKKLYPESAPRQTYQLNVDAEYGHTLHIEEYGNPKGIPAVYLHGGPGAGSDPYHAQLFDAEKYRIIIFDQRGSGKSTPKHCMDNNNTECLVEDLEKIRALLNIDQWVVGGGSWGALLAVVYAEKYPQQTLGLILRGVFLAREQDLTAFAGDHSRAAMSFPTEWAELKKTLGQLASAANMQMTSKLFEDVYQLLTNADKDIAKQAAIAWSKWEESISCIAPSAEEIAWSMTEDGVNMGITEITYMKNKCYIDASNDVLANADKINKAGFPVYLFTGRYDLVCPPDQANALKQALTNATQYFPIAGHSGGELENIHYFITASDDLAKRLALQLESQAQAPKVAAHLRGYLQSASPSDESIATATMKP